MPGGLEGVTGPRVFRNVYEQSAQHLKHMEEILQFMSQWKLAGPLEWEADIQLWTWTQLEAKEEGQEQGQVREGAVPRQLDCCMVTRTLRAAAWVHPRRLILSDHQQLTARRPEGPWRVTEQASP